MRNKELFEHNMRFVVVERIGVCSSSLAEKFTSVAAAALSGLSVSEIPSGYSTRRC